MFRLLREPVCFLEKGGVKEIDQVGDGMIGKGVNKKNRLRLVQPVLQVFFYLIRCLIWINSCSSK